MGSASDRRIEPAQTARPRRLATPGGHLQRASRELARLPDVRRPPAGGCELRSLVDMGARSPDEEARWLERLAALEPFDEDVHRELISAWLRMGRWSRAARHYESFRARLLREFGALPEFELAELARPLRSRRCA